MPLERRQRERETEHEQQGKAPYRKRDVSVHRKIDV